jgi:hypothetical protein
MEASRTGGEGLVFEAANENTGEAVALKMLTAVPVDDYGRVAQRAAAFDQIEHPNLMRHLETFVGPPLTAEGDPDAADFGGSSTASRRGSRVPISPTPSARPMAESHWGGWARSLMGWHFCTHSGATWRPTASCTAM